MSLRDDIAGRLDDWPSYKQPELVQRIVEGEPLGDPEIPELLVALSGLVRALREAVLDLADEIDPGRERP